MHVHMDCLFLLLWTLQVPLVNSASMRLMASVSFGNFIKASDIMKICVMFVFFEALIHKLISVFLQALQFCCIHSVSSVSLSGVTGVLYQGWSFITQ